MKITKKNTGCCSTDSNCCPPQEQNIKIPQLNQPYITNTLNTPIGPIPVIPTTLTPKDKWGTLKVRSNIGRAAYAVEPGLYAVNTPHGKSPVLVSANYKLSFDTLRKALATIDAWILVLDTKAINVWCAAGKGTFGTNELIKRIDQSGLRQIIHHRKLILPQLGAVGVAAHTVKKKSGFSVHYGPVRASDLPAFLESNHQCTPEMRRVHFKLWDRIQVIPVELVQNFKYFCYFAVVYYIIAGFTGNGKFDPLSGLLPALYLFLAYLTGSALSPALLPWLPGRSFSLKGAEAGILLTAALLLPHSLPGNLIPLISWFLVIPAMASYMAMNFTGSSTYTSLSGVKKEMRFAIPAQAAAATLGSVLWIYSRFV